MSRQLTFDLPPHQNLGRNDFLITPANALALTTVDDWRNWPDGKLLITGPPGSGKSHLAHIWAQDTHALALAPRDLAHYDLAHLPQTAYVVVENAHEVAGNQANEVALFHLHNLILPKGRLLLTATTPPRDWLLHLPDLMSRLQATALTRIDPPDDQLLSGVLTKLFADRQLLVSPPLIPYLLARMPRSIDAARALVSELDAKALAKNCPISLRLAAEVLDTNPFDD